MGTICAIMLAQNGHRVRLWSAFAYAAEQLAATRENSRFLPGCRLHDGIVVTGDDKEALAGAELAISAVPTQFIRPVWQRLAPFAPADLPICSVAKGIENHTLLTPTQVLLDVLDRDSGFGIRDSGAEQRAGSVSDGTNQADRDMAVRTPRDARRCAGEGAQDQHCRKQRGSGTRKIAVLSGPSIAPEIAVGLPATVTVAATQDTLAARVQALISRPYFRVYTNADIVGVEIAGATKNVIAIAAGILDGLGAGDNAKAALLTRGLVEITRLGVALGANAKTFAGLAGMGDLVTTCISPLGRNRSFGEAIGKGKTTQEALAAARGVVEGVATTQSVVELARRLNVDMPITIGINAILFENQSPAAAITDLMNRPLKAE
jgi:glycerol-3-phosphate dehydrogenase (NAD(P)+)